MLGGGVILKIFRKFSDAPWWLRRPPNLSDPPFWPFFPIKGGIKKFAPKASKLGGHKKYPQKEGATKYFGAEGAEEGDKEFFFEFREIYSSPSRTS